MQKKGVVSLYKKDQKGIKYFGHVFKDFIIFKKNFYSIWAFIMKLK